MPVSAIFRALGLIQNNHHFASERKREMNQLTVEYEGLLRQTHEVLMSSKLIFDTYLKDLPLDTGRIGNGLEEQIRGADIALEQIEEQRELEISTTAKNLSIAKWDEVISRRQI